MEKYTGKQRVDAAFRAARTDRVPFTTTIIDNRASLASLGITPREYYLNPNKALEALIGAQERFPSDMIWAPGDPLMPEATSFWIESKYGSGVRLPPPLKDKADLANMTVKDPKKHSAFATYLDMCRKVSDIFKDSWIEATVAAGIWSNAGGLRGLETLIHDTRHDPQFVHDLMQFTLEYGKARGIAVAETGVNVLFGDPSAGCSVMSPKIYREFIKPYHIQLFQYLKENIKEDVKVGVHICGYIDPIMEDLVSLPVDWIEMDAPSSLEKMVEINKGAKVIRGNVSADVLSRGTKEQIETEVRRCIEIAAKDNTFILAPGCSMPQNAPLENIESYWKAATKYGYYQ